MKRTAGALLGAAAVSIAAAPAGRPVTIDGRFGAAEWRGASVRTIAPGARLLLRRERATLFIGIRLPPGALRYVEFYVRDGSGRLLNLHMSARYGERVLATPDRDHGPAFVWKPAGWRGSTAPLRADRGDRPIAERFDPYEDYEASVPIAMLGPGPWRYRVELRDFTRAAPDWVSPAGSTLDRPDRWPLLP